MNRSRQRPSVLRIVKRCIIAGLSVIILSVVVARITVTLQVKKLESAIRERGEPVTFDELEEWLPDVPDASNAALAIIEIWADEEGEFWREWAKTGEYNPTWDDPEYEEVLPVLGNSGPHALPWNEVELKAAREFIASRGEHLQQLESALELPHARYPVHYQDGTDLFLAHLAQLKAEVWLLTLDTFLALHESRIDEAIHSVELMARASRTLHSDPPLISQLVYAVCSSITADTCSEVLIHGKPDRRQLEQLRDALLLLEPTDLRRSMITERVWGISAFTMSTDEFAAISSPSALYHINTHEMLIPLLRFTGLWKVDKRFLLETLEKVISESESLHYPEFKTLKETFDGALADARTFPPKTVSAIMLPDLSGALERFVRFETERQLTLLAISVEQYRRANDEELPESLDELTTNLPEFPGLSLGYLPTDHGYTLEAKADDGTAYSVQILYSRP